MDIFILLVSLLTAPFALGLSSVGCVVGPLLDRAAAFLRLS